MEIKRKLRGKKRECLDDLTWKERNERLRLKKLEK